MRIVEIDIGGRTYPLCLTLWVFGQICDRYGSLRECMQRLDDVSGQFERDEETGQVTVLRSEDTQALIEEYLWLLEQLMAGGRQTAALIGKIVPRESPAPRMDQAHLRELLCPGDIPYVQIQVLAAITAGQAREVGTQAPKNGAGADGGQAPES